MQWREWMIVLVMDNNLSPCLDCPLNCDFYDSPMCVSNLVMLSGERTPITFGMHVGLNHVYGEGNLPPCVRGPLGSAYWSTQPGAGTPGRR